MSDPQLNRIEAKLDELLRRVAKLEDVPEDDVRSARIAEKKKSIEEKAEFLKRAIDVVAPHDGNGEREINGSQEQTTRPAYRAGE